MSVYIIASYDILDQDTHDKYVPAVVPLLAKHSAEILVADHDAQVLEGEKRSVYAVLRFASEEAALAWYNDPAYASVKKIRLDSSANNNIALAKAFEPPST